jgi:hypothetical protein
MYSGQQKDGDYVVRLRHYSQDTTVKRNSLSLQTAEKEMYLTMVTHLKAVVAWPLRGVVSS